LAERRVGAIDDIAGIVFVRILARGCGVAPQGGPEEGGLVPIGC
jgi:hypothetical protein